MSNRTWAVGLTCAALCCGDWVRAAEKPATKPAASAPTMAASRPARDGAVEKIRGLVERALAARDDPQEAVRLLTEAAGQVKALPPGSDFERLFIHLDPTKTPLDHLFRGVKGKTVQKKRALSKRLELVETHRIDDLPFTAMADNNKAFIAPIPMKAEALLRQTLLLDGNQVFAIALVGPNAGRQRDFHVSPDERHVVLADWLHAKTMEVLDIATRKHVPVPAPERLKGHDYVYPFGFVSWAEDSRSFSVEVTGTVGRGPGSGLTAYQELWSVDPRTGKASFLKRREKPWKPNLTWEPEGRPKTRPAGKE